MSRNILSILFAAVMLLPLSAGASNVKGSLSVSYYNHDDDTSEYDFNILRTRLKFDASEFMGSKNYFHFNGSTRSAGSNDINSEIPDMRIRTANMEMKSLFRSADLVLGRSYINEIAGERVDGAQLKYWLGDHHGLGVFGGMTPDPYKDDFDGDYNSYGGYGFYHASKKGLDAGYAYKTYKGNEDSSFVHASGYLYPAELVRIFGKIRSDHKVDGGGYELTNMLLNASYRLGNRGRLNATYNQYRAVKLYESMDYNIDHELQNVIRLFADYRVSRKVRIYGSFDTRTRGNDDKSASLWMLGAKARDIFKWFYVDGSYRNIQYFTSDSYQFHGAVGADPRDDVSVEVSLTYMRNDQDNISNSLDQWIYGTSVDWYASKKFFLAGRVELSKEKYLSVDSVYTAKASDEYQSTTFYLQAGYRF